MTCPAMFTRRRLNAADTTILGCSATANWIRQARRAPAPSLIAASCRACVFHATQKCLFSPSREAPPGPDLPFAEPLLPARFQVLQPQ